jgi:hypothetical protein
MYLAVAMSYAVAGWRSRGSSRQEIGFGTKVVASLVYDLEVGETRVQSPTLVFIEANIYSVPSHVVLASIPENRDERCRSGLVE